MNWAPYLAERTRLMKRSAVRELLKLTARPDIISFAGGLPAAELFPVARVKTALARLLERTGGRCLQYGETEGLPELRDWIAAHFSRPHCQVRRENVLITTGGQQALDLVGRVLLEAGDEVLVENPTYLALLSAWRPLGVRFVPVAADAEGIRPDDLEVRLRRRPKLTYLVPNFQNPQGTTLTGDRRRELVRHLERHDAILVEDNPYGELRYDGPALPHLFELAAHGTVRAGLASRVIHTGTFSKVLMPGLRVGWVVAEAELIDKLVRAKQSADLHTSTFCQHLVRELLEELPAHLSVLRRAYRQRRDAMLVNLERQLPGSVTWTRPQGGMFLLVTLPANFDAAALLPAALQGGVAFVPGEEFHLDGLGRNTLRLSFSNASPERIAEGVQRLARVLHGVCGVEPSAQHR